MNEDRQREQDQGLSTMGDGGGGGKRGGGLGAEGGGDKARVAESLQLSLGTAGSLTGNTRTVGEDHRLRDSGALGRCSL